MNYESYFDKFNANDPELFPTLIKNSEAKEFLIENAPRLYCPDEVIEETFAFRTWTMRKHIKLTEAGYVITEFLPDVCWAGKYNTINCPLFHHLREFRWLKTADDYLDYITFFTRGEGSRYSYHNPALSAMYDYCILTKNEDYLIKNVDAFESYFDGWAEKHLTKNGLYWSIDDREGTEFSISGTTPDLTVLRGFRPVMNACMYGDAIALSKIEKLCGREAEAEKYLKKAEKIKEAFDAKLWDGDFYKAVHPLDQDLDKSVDVRDIPEGNNARELMSYIPWTYELPDKGKEAAFKLLKDKNVFDAPMGFASADISNPRFLYDVQNGRGCTWSGKVWPFATSIAINSVITLLNKYEQDVISNADLYSFIKKYAEMHYIEMDGKLLNFIDETMMPFERVWAEREALKRRESVPVEAGGKERGRDYNHSTFIDLVLRGLCGVCDKAETLTVEPRIAGIWKWFKIENLNYRKKTYTVYYDEDGTKFGKGAGVHICCLG